MGRHTLPKRTARKMNALRKTNGAGTGRPRSERARCPCAIMTIKRAQARGKSSEHKPSCSFYREWAIVVR